MCSEPQSARNDGWSDEQEYRTPCAGDANQNADSDHNQWRCVLRFDDLDFRLTWPLRIWGINCQRWRWWPRFMFCGRYRHNSLTFRTLRSLPGVFCCNSKLDFAFRTDQLQSFRHHAHAPSSWRTLDRATAMALPNTGHQRSCQTQRCTADSLRRPPPPCYSWTST